MNALTPTALKTSSIFRLEYSVECEIKASPEEIWALLTNARRFPEWNSTVSKIEGEIELGSRLALQVPLAPGRTFRPKVASFHPAKSMVWRDGMWPMFQGARTFALNQTAPGVTRFEMREAFSGIMLPLIRGSLPDFGPAFATYASDLQRAAETSAPAPQ